MISFLNNFGEEWLVFAKLLVIQNSLFLGFVFLALFLLKNASAQVKYCITLIGLFKLILPPFIPSPFIKSRMVDVSAPAVSNPIEMLVVFYQSITKGLFLSNTAILYLVWMILAISILLIFVVSTIWLKFKLRNSSFLQIFDNGFEKGNSKYKIYQSKLIKAPLTIGFFPKKIFVPENWQEWSADCKRMILSHELAHIKNRDVLYMMMVGVMMGAIIILADIGVRHLFWSSAYRRTSSRGSQQGQAQIIMLAIAIVLIILAPLIAQLIYFAVSRKREYLADASSVQFTRYPEGLADALEKISKKPIKLRAATRATAPLFIVNPLKLTKTGLKNATSTHPPIDQRVKILRSMGGVNQSISFDKYNESFCRITGRKVGVVPFNLEEDTASMGKKPSIIDGRSKHDRVRETTDMLWKLNEYIFITCACGAKLKIPPSYKGKNIPCPHCKEEHNI